MIDINLISDQIKRGTQMSASFFYANKNNEFDFMNLKSNKKTTFSYHQYHQ